MSIFIHYHYCAFGRNTYYFLEYLSGDACKILTTRSLKNSVPALAFIHSHVRRHDQSRPFCERFSTTRGFKCSALF
jgi:hypothetical protein